MRKGNDQGVALTANFWEFTHAGLAYRYVGEFLALKILAKSTAILSRYWRKRLMAKTRSAGRSAQFSILIDSSGSVARDYRIARYPTLVVIDTQGIMRFAGFASGGGLGHALVVVNKLADNSPGKWSADNSQAAVRFYPKRFKLRFFHRKYTGG